MLDRLKLVSQVSQFSGQLHNQLAQDLSVARQVWAQIATDPNFQASLTTAPTPWSLPTWDASLLLSHKNCVSAAPAAYTVIATDGSQVYPDRQMGTNCFLLNIGTVKLDYDHSSSVQLHSEPTIYNGSVAELEQFSLIELVDSKRQELELQAGVNLAVAAKAAATPGGVAGPTELTCAPTAGQQIANTTTSSQQPLLFLID
ncbi:MAG TPA: hypothetical protein VJJ83_03985, partial [Candidatus Babeliales bacterium]|nr:hypothetical protein [Candidatus Babeliales bacterium]